MIPIIIVEYVKHRSFVVCQEEVEETQEEVPSITVIVVAAFVMVVLVKSGTASANTVVDRFTNLPFVCFTMIKMILMVGSPLRIMLRLIVRTKQGTSCHRQPWRLLVGKDRPDLQEPRISTITTPKSSRPLKVVMQQRTMMIP